MREAGLITTMTEAQRQNLQADTVTLQVKVDEGHDLLKQLMAKYSKASIASSG